MEHQIIKDKELLALLQQLQQSGAPASLFVEDQGMGSENGTIESIREEKGTHLITMNGNRSFTLQQVMAVNGTYRTGFSTC
ncbi:hypothetical protein SAMN05444008_107257 [Cnuella takakiae]|uniref:Uncharacterized protein n=1 Tax=Cnuella takakiae TaxID=1302690 RepID=A0A1M5BCK4_9BACT|nr:hypothetical protein [Cnuella takakiae]OLY93433.1 hypothetical protein BUE76_17240 [Cnuella takakiae]SHF40301.1 hypothetical protein SAMN05444008_107257 [Cnuella takakiae]